jgi:hypothetical protein
MATPSPERVSSDSGGITSEPPHIDKDASSHTTPFPVWDFLLANLTEELWTKRTPAESQLLLVLTLQLAELLTFLRNLKIPAWLLKSPK